MSMRFAYIDSQGKQVPIPSVDALRLRIALKAIVDETVFYDAASERWGPAREHEIFRTLKKELNEQEGEGFVAPPLEPDAEAPPAPTASEPVQEPEAQAPDDGTIEGLDTGELEVEELALDGVGGAKVEGRAGSDEETTDDEWHFEISNAPTDAGEAGRPAGLPAEPMESAPHVDPPGGTDPADEVDPGGAASADGAEGDDGGVVPLGTSSWLDLEENEESAVFDLDETHFQGADEADDDVGHATPDGFETLEVPGGHDELAAADPPPLEGLSQDRFEDVDEVDDADPLEHAGWGDEPPPETDEGAGDFGDGEPLMLEGAADAVLPETPVPTEGAESVPGAPGMHPPSGDAPSETEPREPSDSEPSFPTREEVAARRAEAVAKRGPRAGPPPARRRRSRGGVGIAGVVGLLVILAGGGWWFMGRDSRAGSADDGGASAGEPILLPDVPSELEPRMRELAVEVRQATIDDLRALPAMAQAPGEPDRDWLAGIYMASASRYAEIESYWIAMERLLRTLQVAEDSVFVGRLDRTLAREALPTDTAGMLEERILAGFRATSRDRGAVYQRARAVSEAAVRLHAFLVEHEGEIAYVPEVGGLSADPVLEAVPANPALGNEMWDRVGEITAAMDALDFLDRVTTERFVGAVLDRLAEIPVR
jgi:hypothetical protein